MASKLGTMKEKSKSETHQNRAKLRRPPKYKSMTLRRQEAKLDVTLTEDVTDVTFNDSSIALCSCDDCDPPCNNGNVTDINVNVSSNVTEEDTLNNSLINKTSKFLNNLGSKLFVTPPRKMTKSRSAVTDPISRTRKRTLVIDSQVQPLSPDSKPIKSSITKSASTSGLSSSLTTLDSEQTSRFEVCPITNETIYDNVKTNTMNITFPNDKYLTIDARPRPNLDKKLLHGVKQFNLDPKRGLDYLTKGEFLNKDSASEVALFLYREGRLSKKQIGAFIGGHHDFNKKVLSEFVALHEFTHLILVQALRQFLWSFRLPGEAMQIDRIMEAFAKHYCLQNPDLFDETDTCYILSFSIIMLNTTLHNANVKRKTTCQEFVSMNRGLNSGRDIPTDMLEMIYNNIKEQQFKIPEETYDDLMYTFFSPEKEGWLLKQGGKFKTWKRRWFLLNDRCLYYFQHTAENVPQGIIPLENVKVRIMEDQEGKRYLFEIYNESGSVKGAKRDTKGTIIQGNHSYYRMAASSEEDRESWVNTIQDSIKEHPFYDIITSKKAALRRKSLKHNQQHDIPTTQYIDHSFSQD